MTHRLSTKEINHLKRKGILSPATTRMEPEGITLSELSVTHERTNIAGFYLYEAPEWPNSEGKKKYNDGCQELREVNGCQTVFPILYVNLNPRQLLSHPGRIPNIP